MIHTRTAELQSQLSRTARDMLKMTQPASFVVNKTKGRKRKW
jgi:hypothetical protein